MIALYSQGLPYGGSLSAEWILPESLQFLNLGRCNLSGPLPEGWPLPANLTGVTLSVRGGIRVLLLGADHLPPADAW